MNLPFDGFMSQRANQLHQSYLAAVSHLKEENKALPAHESLQLLLSEETESRVTNSKSENPSKPQVEDQPVDALNTGAENQSGDLPDFLSGFDKVTTGNRHGGILGESWQLSSQYSPPFTSRSFDDFHRLLGKDLSPLNTGHPAIMLPPGQDMPEVPIEQPSGIVLQDGGLGLNENLAVSNPVSTQLSEPTCRQIDELGRPTAKSELENSALSSSRILEGQASLVQGGNIGADAYNVFAEVSASAVSQHSAYMPQWFASNGQFALVREYDVPTSEDRKTGCQQPPIFQSIANGGTLCALSKSNVVSEISNTSDVGTEEDEDSKAIMSGSGSVNGSADTNTDNASNDSDGCSSAHSACKKARLSYSVTSVVESLPSSHDALGQFGTGKLQAS